MERCVVAFSAMVELTLVAFWRYSSDESPDPPTELQREKYLLFRIISMWEEFSSCTGRHRDISTCCARFAPSLKGRALCIRTVYCHDYSYVSTLNFKSCLFTIIFFGFAAL